MGKRVLVVDNYDSFTYNLVQYLESLGADCDVRLNDRTTVAAIFEARPDGILLSPGPGTPNDAGVTLDLIGAAAQRDDAPSIFGVCLGHQLDRQSFGGDVVRAERLMHGKTSLIEHDGRTVFRDLPSPFTATRYHSLMLDEGTLPDCLTVTARTPEGEIMGVRHKQRAIEGVQFHPESILTEGGLRMMQNWLDSLGAAL